MVGAGFTPSYGLQLVGNPPLGFETQGSPTWVALLASVKKDFEGDKLYKYDLCKTPLSIFYQNEEHRDENLEFWRETGWTFTWEKKRYHFKVEKSLRQIGSLKITKPPMGDLKKAFPIPDKPLAFFVKQHDGFMVVYNEGAEHEWNAMQRRDKEKFGIKILYSLNPPPTPPSPASVIVAPPPAINKWALGPPLPNKEEPKALVQNNFLEVAESRPAQQPAALHVNEQLRQLYDELQKMHQEEIMKLNVIIAEQEEIIKYQQNEIQSLKFKLPEQGECCCETSSNVTARSITEFLVKRAFGVNHMPIGIAIERLKEVEGGMESIGLTNDDAAALNEFYYNVSDVQVHQNGRKMPNISHISPFYRSLVQRLVSKYQSI